MSLVDEVGWNAGDEDAITEDYDGEGPYQSEERPEEQDPRKTERAPDRPHAGPRESAADVLTMAWGGAGMFLVRTGVDKPVGRMMQFQAGLAGTQLDVLAANTLFDRWILQPMAKMAGNVEALGAVIGGPLLIGLYERNPDMGPLLEGLIKGAVETTLVEMEPLVTKQARRTRKAAQAIANMRKELNLPDDVDPIDAILHMIFQPEEPDPDEEEQ